MTQRKLRAAMITSSHRSGVDGCWRPVPRQKIVETVHGIAVDHALENVPVVADIHAGHRICASPAAKMSK